MFAFQDNDALLKPKGRVLSTMEEDGSRRWLYPKLSKGRFWYRRRAVGYSLIAVFVLIPFLKLRGRPLILLDVVHRKFSLFGASFLPTDTVLLALFAVSTLLFIFFVTALLGRVWCGWACPQTVYMEFLFRPLERLFTGRAGVGGAAKGLVPSWRRATLYLTYFVASFFLAHTFLSYFVGVEQLRHWMTHSPVEHPAGFLVVVATTGLMLFNFGFFREQLCIIACPYGRFQSALLDKNSLVISYDKKRGEPRGAAKKTALPVVQKGDCVDCDLCVTVCPTGIDIRDGLQIECVGCAQCIDACDAVMKKIGKPLGLIRYSSQSAMAGERSRVLRPRVVVYPAIMVALMTLMIFLLLTHAPTDVQLLRGLGRPFVLTDAGEIENVMRVKLTNRSDKVQRLHIAVADRAAVHAFASQETITLEPGQSSLEPVRIIAPATLFSAGTLDVTVRVSGEGIQVDRPFRLLGPLSATTQPGAIGDHHAEH